MIAVGSLARFNMPGGACGLGSPVVTVEAIENDTAIVRGKSSSGRCLVYDLRPVLPSCYLD